MPVLFRVFRSPGLYDGNKMWSFADCHVGLCAILVTKSAFSDGHSCTNVIDGGNPL